MCVFLDLTISSVLCVFESRDLVHFWAPEMGISKALKAQKLRIFGSRDLVHFWAHKMGISKVVMVQKLCIFGSRTLFWSQKKWSF